MYTVMMSPLELSVDVLAPGASVTVGSPDVPGLGNSGPLAANVTDADVAFPSGATFAAAVGKKVSLTFSLDGPALVYTFGFR